MFFGKYGSFSATTSPNPARLSNFFFGTLSPIPSFTGKFAPKFLGTLDSSITVSFHQNRSEVEIFLDALNMFTSATYRLQ